MIQPALVGIEVFPDFFLLLVIVADGERHQAIERHLAFTIERDQLRADPRELQPLPHHLNRHAEPRGDTSSLIF